LAGGLIGGLLGQMEIPRQQGFEVVSGSCGGQAVKRSFEPEIGLDAIVDFTFNFGGGRLQTSTLRRRVNQRDWLA
jgi:GH24 family phage-related lysozyme (muramidase)